MINILSYVGMNMQSEVCLWTLLGIVRTIFDATLFKVNANLKQVWQMTMPEELTMPVQRVLRTMISGVMLVQCFTVYVYLASYIVLLYPVLLEERPTLVLPWLLLAAVRKLLCELTCLALGLGTCVLLGPARPPCIKFVVVKFASIMPAFYMWMLVFSYYHSLKVASAFKTFPAVLPSNDHDYGLELAVRRRRTKSLLGEDQLRKKLVANFYGDSTSINNQTFLRPTLNISSRMVHSTDTSLEEVIPETDAMKPLSMSTTGWSDIGAYEDWFGSEVMIPRDTDRILEQIVLMLLRIGAYLKKEGIESIVDSQILNSAVPESWHHRDNIECAAMNADDTETPPLVGSSKGNMASYLREYPQIFMKKQGTDISQTERTIVSLKTVHSHNGTEDVNTIKNRKRVTPDTSDEMISIEVENVPSKRKITITDNLSSQNTNDKLTLPRQLKSKQNTKTKIQNSNPEYLSKNEVNKIPNKVTDAAQVSSLHISEINKEVEYNIPMKSSFNVPSNKEDISLRESKTSVNKSKSKESIKTILSQVVNQHSLEMQIKRTDNDETKQSLANALVNDTNNGMHDFVICDKESVDNISNHINKETEKYEPTALPEKDLLSMENNEHQRSLTLGGNDDQIIESANNSNHVFKQSNSKQVRNEFEDIDTKKSSDKVVSNIKNEDGKIETIQAGPLLKESTATTAITESAEINKDSVNKVNYGPAESKTSLNEGKRKESEDTISSQASKKHNSDQNNKKPENKEPKKSPDNGSLGSREGNS